MIRHRLLWMSVLLLLPIQPLSAQSTFQEDDLSFEIESPASTPTSNTKLPLSDLRFSMNHEISINPNHYRGLETNRSNLQLEFEKLIDNNLYAKFDARTKIYSSQDIVSETNNKQFETRSRVKEAWLQGSWGRYNVKLGKQNIVWSEVDSSRATDTINALDNSELLFTDFDNARLGQWMLSGQYFQEGLSWEAFINIAPKFNLTPPQNVPIEKAESPDPEAGLRMKTALDMAEVAVFVANLAPNQVAIEVLPRPREKSNRFWYSGLSANLARGKLLLKADLAYKTDQAYYHKSYFSFVYKDVVDIALGAEYIQQLNTYNVSATRTFIQNWQETLATKRQAGLLLLSWSRSYFNKELLLNALYGKLYQESSQYASVYIDYHYDDHISLVASYFWFNIDTTNRILAPLNDSDRFGFKIEYQI